MGGTIFLLGALFVVLGSVLVYYFSYWGVIFIGGFLVVQWFYSDRIALYSMGGREVTPEEAPQLHAIVDRLCALADMPKPKVAIADTDVPNAFATGRSPSERSSAPPPASCAGWTSASWRACCPTSSRTWRTAT